MKKIHLIFIGAIIFLFALVYFGQNYIGGKENQKGKIEKSREVDLSKIKSKEEITVIPTEKLKIVSLDFGDGNKLTYNTDAKNAFLALKEIAEANGFEVDTKKYQFGLMVRKIGEKENSNQAFWSFKVNGKLAKIASDRFLIYPGDQVEWEYKGK